MVFIDFVLLGLVAGLLLGGRLGTLADIELRGAKLVYGAIALQVVAFPSGVLPWSTPDHAARALWLISYALLLAFALRNAHLRGVVVLGIGLCCNLAAIVANAGLMPVLRGALDDAGLDYALRNNSVRLTEPQLSWLVDRWAAPSWIPFGNVYSIGDVLIAIGVTVAVASATRPSARVAVERAAAAISVIRRTPARATRESA